MSNHEFTEDDPGTLTAAQLVALLSSAEPARVVHATITGMIRLTSQDVRPLIEFQHVTFAGHVDLSDSRFARSVNFRNCHFQAGLNATNTRIDGSFVGTSCVFANEPSERFALSLRNSDITGNVIAPGLTAHGDLDLTGVNIRGRCELSSEPDHQTSIDGSLMLQYARIRQQLNLTGARISGSLLAENLNLGGEMYLFARKGQRSGVKRQIRLSRATIGGVLAIDGCEAPEGIFAPYSQLHGPVQLGISEGWHCDIGPCRFTHATCETSVEISGARIRGDVDLFGASLGSGLLVTSVEVKDESGDTKRQTAIIEGDLQLAHLDCSGGISIHGAFVKGNLVLYSSSVRRDTNIVPFQGKPSVVGKDIVLARASFGGQVSLNGIEAQKNIDLEQARISGPFLCTVAEGCRPEVECDVTFVTANVMGQVNLSGLVIKRDLIIQRGIFNDGFVGGVENKQPTVVQRDVIFRSSEIFGTAELTGVQVGRNLSMFGVSITHDLSLSSDENARTTIRGDSVVTGCEISGQCSATAAMFCGSFRFQSCRIQKGLFLGCENGQRVEVAGDLLLMASQIGATLDLSGVKIVGGVTISRCDVTCGLQLVVDGERRPIIGGDLSLRATHIADKLEIRGVSIGGDLEADDAVFDRGMTIVPDGPHQSEITGDVSLFSTKSSKGVLIYGTNIGKRLVLHGAEIDGEFRCASSEEAKTVVGGIVWLFRAHITGRVSFDGITAASGMKLTYAIMDSGFTCLAVGEKPPKVVSMLSFHGAKATDVAVDGRALTESCLDLVDADFGSLELRGRLSQSAEIAGFHCQRLELPENSIEVDLLRLDKVIARDTYLYIENWLRNRGDTGTANQVYRDLRERQNRRNQWWSFARWRNWFFDWTTGYGTSSWRLFALWIFVFMATAFVFSDPASVERKDTLTGGDGSHSITERKSVEHPTNWLWHDACWSAARVALPMLSAVPGDEWEPSSNEVTIVNRRCWFSYETFAFVVSICCWAIVPYFLAAWAGLFKRRE